jgi:hypothetical protein
MEDLPQPEAMGNTPSKTGRYTTTSAGIVNMYPRETIGGNTDSEMAWVAWTASWSHQHGLAPWDRPSALCCWPRFCAVKERRPRLHLVRPTRPM